MVHLFRTQIARLAVILLCGLLTSGCSTLAYYSQATYGHLALMQKRQPIKKLLADATLSTELERKLELVLEIRQFAVDELNLPDNESYKSFADLRRRYVVWNVFATPTLSLEPIRSCFYFVGCLSYRGYFSEEKSREFANTLSAAGNDVFVGGVAAYSTLGWFDDPVLNTMLYWDNIRLARVIFHELSHQMLYVKDDASFNESFATAVAEIGIQRWLDTSDREDISLTAKSIEVSQRRDKQFINLILGTREDLENNYNGNASNEEKIYRKQIIFADLITNYERLKKEWDGYDGYDEWMYTNLNNAKIASVVTYHGYEEKFMSILKAVDNDLKMFYEKVAMLADLEKPERDKCLESSTQDVSLCILSWVTH